MLSIKVIQNAGVTATYFAKDDYYAKDDPEAQKASMWYGKGAESFGLEGPVTKEQFRELLEGKLPDGTQLGRRGKDGEITHRPGWDLTFSAPKSVSVLYEVGGDKRILEAHERAVGRALDYIEGNAAKARVRVGGQPSVEQTGNLVVARFNHDTSREMDPQLHTHSIVMNMTQRENGQWRSIESRHIYRLKMLGGAIYRAELAKGMRDLGYEVERTHNDGRFEATAVPKEVIKEFSKRREAIEKVLEKSFVKDAKAAEQVALNTRAYKRETERDALRVIWKDAAKEFGFDAEKVVIEHGGHVDDRQSDSLDVSRNDADRTSPISSDGRSAPENEPHRDRSELDLSGLPDVPLSSKNPTDAYVRDDRFVTDNAREAVAFAAAKLGERESVFTNESLLLEALVHSMGDVTLGDVAGAVREAKAEKSLVSAILDEREAWTTPNAMYLERTNIAIMRDGQEAVKPMYKMREIGKKIDGHGFTPGQRDAAVMVLTSADRVMGVQGYAGTGKTYMLNTVREYAEKKGYQVRGFAPSATAANLLGNEAEIKSNTLARHLLDMKKVLTEKDESKRNRAIKEGGYDKQLWVVDESSMVSSRDMYDFLKVAEQTGARVLLVGDVKQLPAVEAGKPFAQLQRGGMNIAVMQDILRQKNPQALEAVKDSIQGHARAALEKIKEGVHQIEDKEARLGAIADHFLSLSPEERESTLVLSPANEDRAMLNNMIRDGLVREGVLEGERVEDTIYVKQGLTRVEKARASSYEAGQIVLFQRAYRSLGVGKGEYARVVDIDKKNGVVKIRTFDGKEIDWSPHKVAGNRKKGGVEVFREENRDLIAGDKIRWTRNDKDREIRNAEMARVLEVKGNDVTFMLSNGSKITVDVTRPENRHWEHAYTSTVYSAQGQTTSRVLVNGEDFRKNLTNQKMFYVALSRAKDDIHVYVNDSEKFIKAVEARSGDKMAALDSVVREQEFGGGSRRNDESGTKETGQVRSSVDKDGLAKDSVDYKQIAQERQMKEVDRALDR